MLAERVSSGGDRDEAAVEAGSVISAAAFLSGTRTSACFRAARRCRLLALGNPQLESLLVNSCSFSGLAVRSNCRTKTICSGFRGLEIGCR